MKLRLLAVCVLGLGSSCFGAMITVPNGTFSSSANNGTIQGSILSGGQTAIPLGSGPWSASTASFLGLLAPPRATIGSGKGSITNLLGLGVAGQSNSARFYQTLTGTSFVARTTYTLSAVIDSEAALSSTIVLQNGIGIALTAGGVSNVVASSSAGFTLTPLSGTQYRLELQYTTSATAPSGDLGLKLYAGENASLLSIGLLGKVGFDDVTLSATTVPEPSVGVFLFVGVAAIAVSRRRIRSGIL